MEAGYCIPGVMQQLIENIPSKSGGAGVWLGDVCNHHVLMSECHGLNPASN